MRTLRSKRLRNALWLAAGGKCQTCGCDLPDGWHADHVIPYSVTRRTNVHEMQALCPGCNLRKSNMKLRTHQARMEELCKEIISGAIRRPDFIISDACPGAGKSVLPVIMAHYFIEKARIADKVCWVVPNGSLREQAIDAFGNTKVPYQIYGHRLQVVESTNTHNPSKDTSGYVTTYQALACDSSKINLQDFERHRYLLVLDELHHLGSDTPWHKAVISLVGKSAFVLGMTGTIDRNDRLPIYPLPYGHDCRVCKDNTDEIRWINYSIRQATAERAIIKAHFQMVDGASQWYDQVGEFQEAETFGDNKNAVFSALKTEFAFELLDSCVEHWKTYRAIRPRSKLLVVCADVKQAKRMQERLRKKHSINSDIATYREEMADESIKAFRYKNDPPALVTVNKAYEGLDVPSITHIVALTHIRSRPWILQMIARGWRYDSLAGPWESQVVYIFSPSDLPMQECIKQIESEQEESVKELDHIKKGVKDPPPNGDGGPEPPGPDCIPISSQVTSAFCKELGGEEIDEEETAIFTDVANSHGLTPIQVKQAYEDTLRRMEQRKTQQPMSQPKPTVSANTRINALRRRLNELVGTAAAGDGPECARINAQISSKFGQREAMGEKTLLAAIKWMHQIYGFRLRKAK